MKLSFGMIFSIILIIFFLAFAFYGIRSLLKTQKEAEIQKFMNDFQNDVTQLWKETQGSKEVEYSLPGSIEAVCFTDNEYENLFFEPDEHAGKKIEYIDIGEEDPYCVENENGKVNMILKKAYGTYLVEISRAENG